MARRKTGAAWNPIVADRVKRRRAFEKLVAKALDDLPEELRGQMENVAVIVEDAPGHEDLLGLYEGIARPERDAGYSGVLPDRITIYRLPIESRARTAEDLEREVRTTVWHEIAHHFGISDERLRELGWD